jgi:ribosome-associated heat shock protein Hsp15
MLVSRIDAMNAPIMPCAADGAACGEYLELAPMRLDKWLWAARFFKTRSLASEAIERHRVQVNGQPVKPARELKLGDVVTLRLDALGPRDVVVRGLALQRGPAAVAQRLYEETPASTEARRRAAEQRRLAPEPAATQPEGRPTKRDRRDIERAAGGWQRWSASIDD